MFSLKKHLDSNEQVVHAFRPARRAYIFHYLLDLFLIFISLAAEGYLIMFGLHIKDINQNIMSSFVVFYFFAALVLFSLIMLLRIEWRIWSRRYAVTTERILYSRGIFSETFKSIQFAYITDISFRQNLWDRIINTGSLVIDTASNKQDIVYRKVADPLKIKKMINDAQSTATGGLKMIK